MGSLDVFVTRYRALRAKSAALNEAETRKQIIDRFLEALGWEDDAIRLEVPVQTGSSSHHVDYVLTVDGRSVALLEAKAFGHALAARELQQAYSYGRILHIRWCMVSNGVEVVVLDADQFQSILLQAKTAAPH